MKKITLASLLIFLVVVSTIFTARFLSLYKQYPSSFSNINPPILKAQDTPSPEKINNDSMFSTNEIASHSTPDDCYLVINNSVYDVSNFISLHPGGSRQITSRCGKEVSGIFARIHSNRAWDLLAKYKIGALQVNNTLDSNTTKVDLNTIKDGLMTANPGAEIVNIKPSDDIFIAKVIKNHRLVEVHIDESGQIIKQEVESEEFDWSLWDTDVDDK